MKTTWKKVTPFEFGKQGNTSLEGQIIEFDPPLFVHGFKKIVGEDGISIFPRVRSKEPIGRFVEVTGGFGASLHSMGRMIIFDKIFKSIEDVENDTPIKVKEEDGEEHDTGGNTKEYPSFVWTRGK